ncbi:hypothetical protein CAPTEDRAFT_133063 [Capitella teleta]|uniref:EGF-like domain-containing protein n=1 Tax=Capitella teleta TaxID=283909 RepID=N1PB91_CAPTE|nr:hypothetical protein CAPTEDRAFT_133063 [Capitella teleta]|eukprot:ELU18795.1 hypothetical protein CAPTEDRAFT_133063 [Capitella teleta]
MAGIGEACGRQRRHQKSCLAQGRVDVYRRPDSKGCDFNARFISGVVCCKRQKRNFEDSEVVTWWKPHKCSPKCANGGRCIAPNQCACAQGYKGVWCQNPICPGGCIPHSECYKPGMCRCLIGFTGPKCQSRDRQCRPQCMHGGVCRLGKCTCPATHHGSHCQHGRQMIE